MLFNWPGWAWQSIGVGFLIIFIIGTLYSFQRQLDAITVTQPAPTPTNHRLSPPLPHKPKYSRTHAENAKEQLSILIEKGQQLRGHISPNGVTDITDLQAVADAYAKEAEALVRGQLPEYSQYFVFGHSGVWYPRRHGWDADIDKATDEIEEAVAKLKKILFQIQA